MKAAHDWLLNRIEEILMTLCRIVIPWDKIADNGKVRELCAPATPFTDLAKWPLAISGHILAAAPSKWVCPICNGINTDIQEVVVEHLEKLFRSLDRYKFFLKTSKKPVKTHTSGVSCMERRSPEAILQNSWPDWTLLASIHSAMAWTGHRWASGSPRVCR